MCGSSGTEYGMWGVAAAWALMFGAFVLFLPLRLRADRRPAGIFLAFVLAFALERYGAPFSRCLFRQLFGLQLPCGILWGHTLCGTIGMAGHYLFLAALPAGGALVVAGWAGIRGSELRREGDEGRLVEEGLYRFIRHPQYAGLLLLSLALLFEWATLPLLILWPVLLLRYCRLARAEEVELARRFGEQWRRYARETGRFFPRISAKRGKGRRGGPGM